MPFWLIVKYVSYSLESHAFPGFTEVLCKSLSTVNVLHIPILVYSTILYVLSPQSRQRTADPVDLIDVNDDCGERHTRNHVLYAITVQELRVWYMENGRLTGVDRGNRRLR